MSSGPPVKQFLDEMLLFLGKYLPQPAPNLPEPSISIISLEERPLSIGNRRGVEQFGLFPIIELKGGRLNAVVRFHIWGVDLAGADKEIQDFQGRLLANADILRSDGFLDLAAEGSSDPELIGSQNAWRRTADYRVLYEFHYEDTDDAESIMARIPINIDGELTTVSDRMVRWDNLSAPILEARGEADRTLYISSVCILAFLPGGWDGKGVIMSSSIGGLKHELNFPSVRAFRDAFDLESQGGISKTVILGGKSYLAGRMLFPNIDFPEPLTLNKGDDSFNIKYVDPSFENNSEAVVYLRLLSTG